MSKIIGIDLGTTNSAVAVIQGGKPEILENKEGNRTTPSMVALSKSNERLVGMLAKRQAVVNPKNTLFSIKRLIGRKFDDKEVQDDIKTLPYEVQKAGEGVKIVLGDKSYTPQEISAMILQKLKADAEEKLGEKVEEAIITVPAYFDDAQRQATKDAGEIAGLKVKRIINEPTAAAFAYGFDRSDNKQVAVYDLGGGTFDISILDISHDTDSKQSTVEVKSTTGDTHLGGDDFDQRIITWIIDEYKKDQGIDLSKDVTALQRLKESAEKAKIELSTSVETEINQPFITTDASGPKHLVMKITRSKLEEIVGDLVEKTLEPCKKAIEDAKFKKEDIDEVILVGGMTRMPFVQKKVEEFFGKKPNVSVNPDEVVALGAAVQAGQFEGSIGGKEVLLLDVTPLTLGIETLGGVMTPLIEKNTTIPSGKSQIFSTAADSQTSVEIHVLQGERQMAQHNKTLGRFILSGIPPAPRGIPQIEVTFDIDANGILNVKAVDKATGTEQKITITASSGLSKEEIEKMKQEAEANAEEDKKKKEEIETINSADSVIYSTERLLKDTEDKTKYPNGISDDTKKKVQDKLDELKKSKDSNNVEDMKKKLDEMNQVVQEIGQEMYKQSQAGSQQPNPEEAQSEPQAEEKKEEPVEAEFEEEKK
ncbi:MAG: molecular chaperone DnaK [Patescibacteria group bacterium]|nr:molecular chaperone DnaK [Patescibacteria group bacterium]MDD4304685.1 molecular chaperone DnaK [Patescibacteria group bacterium]MDD4695347.1 molecular chaperone DnaK [Patescibacteria group bacterium]